MAMGSWFVVNGVFEWSLREEEGYGEAGFWGGERAETEV